MTRTRGVRYVGLAIGIGLACAASFGAGLIAQQSLEGAAYRSAPGGTRLDILFDGVGRDVPVDVAILTFPPGTNSGDHEHDQTEIFYVLEGQLEHVVNGRSTILGPGMLGHVSPPDLVNHITTADGGPTRAIVIWSPAGGAAGIASRWERVTSDEESIEP